MRNVFSVIVLNLLYVCTIAQIKVDTLKLDSLGFETVYNIKESQGRVKKYQDLLIDNRTQNLVFWSFSDGNGFNLDLGKYDWDGDFSSMNFCLAVIDSLCQDYHWGEAEGFYVSTLNLNHDEDFCFIEQKGNWRSVRSKGFYYFKDGRVSEIELKKTLKYGDYFFIDSRIDFPEIKIELDLDNDGNGLQKTYNSQGMLVKLVLYKNGYVFDKKEFDEK